MPLTGAFIGALFAAVLLINASNMHVLEVELILVVSAAAAFQMVNYAIYCAAIAAGVLMSMGTPDSTNLTAEAERFLFNLAGVA